MVGCLSGTHKELSSINSRFFFLRQLTNFPSFATCDDDLLLFQLTARWGKQSIHMLTINLEEK